MVEGSTMERADPLKRTPTSSERPAQTKQLSRGCVAAGDVAKLLQPERVSDLPGKDSPLHGHPLISTALNELHGLELLLEGKKVRGCHTFDVEVFNVRHLFEGLLDRCLKGSSCFVTPLQTSGLDPLAAILGICQSLAHLTFKSENISEM